MDSLNFSILLENSSPRSRLWKAAQRETASTGGRILEDFSKTLSGLETSAQKKFLPLLRALKNERNNEFLLESLVQIGVLLKSEQEEAAAGVLLERLSQADVPERIRECAKREYGALVGKESFGMRMEHLVSRMAHDNTALRSIAPFVGTTIVGQIAGTALLGGLERTAWSGFLSRGLGKKGISVAGTFLAEVSTLVGLNHIFSPASGGPLSEEFLRTGLNWGVFRLCGGVGARLAPARGPGQAPLQLLFSHGSTFAGLLGVRHLEERFHLRPIVENATRGADALSAMADMLIGSSFGKSLLGRPWAAFRKDIEQRAQESANRGRTNGNAESWRLQTTTLNTSAGFPSKRFEKNTPLDQQKPLMAEKWDEGIHPGSGGLSAIPGYSKILGPVIPAAPPTAKRGKPEFKLVKAAEDSTGKIAGDLKPIGDEALSQVLLTSRSRLSTKDQLDYTRFVLARLPDYPSVLMPFSLPNHIADLQAALAYFCERFSDESDTGLKSVFRETGILPQEASLANPLNHEMLILLREVKSDAVYYLDRLDKLLRKNDPAFSAQIRRLDPTRLRPQLTYPLTDWQELQDPETAFPELTVEVLRGSYERMVWDRVLTQTVYRNIDNLPFAVTDAGHEVFGTAAAYAFHHGVNPQAFAISPHYRSSTLLGTWAHLRGYGHEHFVADYLRQQLSRKTDIWTGGTQTASHFFDPRYEVLPGQSEVGRNLLKGVGYARALQQAGHKDAVVYAEIGDGSMALSDFYEAMTGANLMGYRTETLPLIVGIADNRIAISVEPRAGRALVDLQAFAKSLGADFYTCDGNDYLDVYQTYRVAVARSRRNQTPAIIWVQNLSRLNGHSSASDYNFDFKQHDPLRDIGAALVAEGILREEQILRRRDNITRNRFFDNHDLGEIGREVQSRINELWEQVAQEPEPTLESMLQNVRLAYSQVQEPAPTHRPTVITIKGAIRAGLRDNIEKNPRTLVTGQDVAKMGGVNKATMGLWDLFPDNVTDAPINEPLIISSALGFALHEGAVAFPEIQFGDYFRSAYHWVYYIGGLLFTSGGKIAANINIRLPVDPIGKGAIYHSASLDAELAHIPGLTVLCFSNTRDAYGMIRSAAEYPGPVVILEPKILYGVATGDAFENEPPDQFNGARLAKEIFHGAIPDIPKDFRVPLGKAAVRREGKDLTLLTWGLAHYKTVARGHDHKDPSALDKLVESGIDVELIDLRTLVPPDMATVLASVEKTGRLLVVHEDRVFAGLGSEIVRQTRERFADRIIASEILGMEPVSGIPQHQPTERAVTVNSEKIVEAGMRVMGQKS